MSQPTISKTSNIERLEARITKDKKMVLKNAADLSGRSLTDFVIHSAYEAAVRIIEEYQHIHLSINDQRVFIQTLLNPPEPSQKLANAVRKYKKDVLSK